jgi:hypothetical protein
VACEKELTLHPTKAMQHIIAKLYAHVFLFIEDTMDWYLKKPRLKLRDAFRENFFERFEKMIVNIQDLSSDVLRAATLSTMGEIREIRYTTEDIAESITTSHVDIRLALDGISREQAETKLQLEQLQLDKELEREERRQLELNAQQRMESFCNKLVSRIATGIHQELVGVAQKSLNERSSGHSSTYSVE